MSNMRAETDRSSRPLSCHCHVVCGDGRQIPAPSAGPAAPAAHAHAATIVASAVRHRRRWDRPPGTRRAYSDGTAAATVAAAPERSERVGRGRRHAAIRRTLVAAVTACAALIAAAPAAAAPPVASFALTGGDLIAGTPVTLTSTSTDPDGDALTASWDVTGDGAPDQTGNVVTFTFGTPGPVTVALTVADAAGESAATARTLAVLAPAPVVTPEPAAPPPPPPANVAPTAVFLFNPQMPIVGQPIAFASASADADGTIATERWDLNGDGRFGDAIGPNVTHAFAQPGPHVVRLRVRDSSGAMATVSRTVNVNGPPTAAFTVAPAVVVAGTSAAFQSTSADADGAITRIEWSLDGDGQFDDGGDGTVTRAYETPGVIIVRVRVTDDRGATAIASGVVTVVADKPPLASFVFAPAAPVAGIPVVFSSRSSDPDGAIVGLAWDLDGDGFFDDAAGASATWTYRAAGQPTVSLRATDDRGASSISFQTLSVRGASKQDATAASPGVSASGVHPPRLAPSPGPPLISPFPVVRIRGQILGEVVRIELLSVRAPRGATITVRCRGVGCPTVRRVVRARSSSRPQRLRSLEQRYRPGARIEVFVTMRGRIGKYVRFTLRRKAAPERQDLCLGIGGRKPMRCPTR
jgi:PKD repeat protein